MLTPVLDLVRIALTERPFTDRSALYRIPLELVKNRKLHNEMLFFFFEFVFDSFKIPQISKHVFLLRSTFVIEDFDEYSILVFKL